MLRLGKGEALVLRGQAFDALCLVVQGSLETRILNPDGAPPPHQLHAARRRGGHHSAVLDGLGHINDLLARSANTLVLAHARRLPCASCA